MSTRGFLGIASAIALVSLIAKGFGFGREVVIAAVFGASAAKDAYTIAYILPAFAIVMLGGLTGPFHTATQKMITTLREQGQDEVVPAAVATVLVGVLGAMGALSVLTYFAAGPAIALVGGTPAPEVTAIAIEQLRIMSPLVLLGGLVGVFCGISNDRGDYTIPSLSPLIASVTIIAVVLWRHDATALAWGTLAGGIGQFLIQAPAAWKLLFSGGRLRMLPDHPAVRAMAWLLLPAAVSSTIGTLNVMIGVRFSATLATGDIGVFDYANKLIQLPLGILMTALLIPIFPLMTRAAVSGDRAALFDWLNRGLSTIALTTLPLIAYFVVGGESAVRLIFERAQFDAGATVKTAEVLAWCSIGIWSYACRDLMIRVFFALDDSRTPLFVSLVSLALTTGFMAIAIGPFGLNGLAAATSAVTLVNMLLVAGLLRRKLGELPLGSALGLTVRALIASCAAAGAAYAAGQALPPMAAKLDDVARLVDSALRVTVQAGVLTAVYVGALAVVGVPLRDFLSRLRRRPVAASTTTGD